MPNTEENIRIKRTGKKFQFKQVVTDLLINVVCDSIVAAKSYIEKTKYTTFCFGELQMHSIIIPALAKNTDCFILEYPIERSGKRIILDVSIIIADAMWTNEMNIICS